jgi:adenylate kinase family enzyme
LVDKAFEEVADTNFLFMDGLPRNLRQLPFALERARHFGFERVVGLYIDTPVDIAIGRLLERARDDTDRDLIALQRRHEVFAEETQPMITRISRNAEHLGIEYHMICGINLRKNMPKYIPFLIGG